MVALADSSVRSSAGEALAARLDDPQVAESLNQLLDHADLLAVLVSGLSEFVARGDTITDSLAGGINELRSIKTPEGLDVPQLLAGGQQLAALAPSLIGKLPVLERLLGSDLADSRVIDIAAMASRSAIKAVAQDQPIAGIRALVKAMRDPDVGRAIGFILATMKALGQELPH